MSDFDLEYLYIKCRSRNIEVKVQNELSKD